MAEIKTPPIKLVDPDGNVEYIFTDNHSFADVARWIISEGGAEEVIQLLQELSK